MPAQHPDLQARLDDADRRINLLGASMLFHPVTLAAAAARGVDDAVVLYAGGRAGAMGDVNAAAVEASFGFFAPESVADVWPAVLAAGRPTDIAEIYAEALAECARKTFDAQAAATVASVGWALADHVPALGLPLFSGWRAMPRPSDPGGAAGVAVMALRELRGEVHVQCVAAAGLHPLEAEVVSRGAGWAPMHGWKEPYPDPELFRARVAAADAETSRRMRVWWDRLDPGERDDLTAALGVLQPDLA